ncbi:Hypothetical predicted protein [Mytilus galloprovincialis]|uniref:Ig-like domain-containing protein n=1 Tax=Mytilus galloprovincialis TaxID=29158 RepID=A0A8B6BFH3_MYTGA|nr:Hypothetical predicted protein [Mytilus galloprovincialis]
MLIYITPLADIPVSTVTRTRISQIIGSPARLSCDTRANPSASEWQWFHNGISLSSTSKVLVVDIESDSEAGAYTCRAVNGVGTSLNISFNVDIVSGTVSGPDAAVVVDDTFGLSSGEIVAIILAILFVLLSFLVVCCCYKGYCASLCGRKQEQVSQKVEHGRVEIPTYNKETVESVIHLHKLGIPKFYENPETTELARDNTYVTPTQTCQQYLPNIEYTYNEEEEQRRRRRRKRKNNKRDQDKQMHEHIVHQIET